MILFQEKIVIIHIILLLDYLSILLYNKLFRYMII